jgi:hypothetical protein
MSKLSVNLRSSTTKFLAAIFLLTLAVPSPARPDTIILQDGSSYVGQFAAAPGAPIAFVDPQGIQYQFPLRDVQSLVFTTNNDIVTLRSGKVYSGHYTGATPIPFTDNQGVGYQFPVTEVATLVFTHPTPVPSPAPGSGKVIPVGMEITIVTNDTINAKDSGTGQLYSATINADVNDANGNVAIPGGTPAKLVVRDITTGGAVHSPELVLDLFSVTVKGQEYHVVSADVDINNKKGVGANRRTAEFGGGGAASAHY